MSYAFLGAHFTLIESVISRDINYVNIYWGLSTPKVEGSLYSEHGPHVKKVLKLV